MPETARKLDATPDDAADAVLDNYPIGWITTAQAADVLGRSERTVRYLIDAGRVEAAKVRTASGVRWYIDPASHGDLAAIYAPRASSPTAVARMNRLTDKQRRVACERAEAVRDWQGYRDRLGERADVKMAFRLWADDYATRTGRKLVSYRTMCRWINELDGGDIADLAPRYRGRRPDEPDAAAWAFFCSLYLQRSQPKLRDCHRQTRARAEAEGWTWIGEAATRAKVDRDIDPGVRIEAREGPKAYADHYLPSILRDYTSIAANEVWVADHHQIDVAVRRPDNGHWCFPWLTCWFDMRSRRVVGAWLSADAPNSDTVIASLRRAVAEHGIPDCVYLDNGKDFRALDVAGGKGGSRAKSIRVELDSPLVRGVLELLECDVIWAQAYNAQAKIVERWFRTLRDGFHRWWPTYRGAGVRGGGQSDRPEGLAKLLRDCDTPGAVPELAELEAALGDWIANVYHQRPHSGHGMDNRTPDEVYRAELARVRVCDDRDLAFMAMRVPHPDGTRRVMRNGVHVLGAYYHSTALMAYYGQDVMVRYDPAEIGRVFCFTAEGRYIGPVSNTGRLSARAEASDLRRACRNKSAIRKHTKAQLERLRMDTGDAAATFARQRQAAEAEAAARDPGTPGPDPDGGEPGSQPNIVPFASELARAAGAEMLRDARGITPDVPRKRAVMDEPPGPSPEARAALRLMLNAGDEQPTRTLPGGEVVDADGTVVEDAKPAGPPTSADLLDAMDEGDA